MLKANNYQRSGNMERTRENTSERNPRKYGEPLLQKRLRAKKYWSIFLEKVICA